MPRLATLVTLGLAALAAGGGVVRGDQPPPLPLSSTEYAVVEVGDAGSGVRMDAFVDLVCADTKAVWPVVKDVIAKYGRSVHWKFHLFPLPYHTNAFAVARGAVTLAALTNATTVLNYFDLAFDRQEQVLNGPTADMTYNEVQDRIASWGLEVSGLSPAEFTHGWNQGSVDAGTRFGFKYAAFRSVIGTPTFLLNAVPLPELGSGSTVKDFSKYIDPLVSATERA